MPSFRNVREYYVRVVNLVAASGLSDDWVSIKVVQTSRTQGAISANPLHFRNGSTLRFREEIVLGGQGEVARPVYSYRFERPDGFYFGYDRDPDRAEPFCHQECHLHVNARDPRYPTHATSFEEVFGFVRECLMGEG